MDKELIKAVEDLNEKLVLRLVQDRYNSGIDHITIQNSIKKGMENVGELYAKGEYFIADLIMSGIIYKNVLKLKEMNLHKSLLHAEKVGKLLIGTAKQDLHDIGKDIFSSMMDSAGFEVYDIGVDVSPETFVRFVTDYKPDIVGISGVLTLALDGMKETVEAISEAGLRDQVKIILGGNAVSVGAEFVGADAFTTDPTLGVKLCLDWVKQKSRQQMSQIVAKEM